MPIIPHTVMNTTVNLWTMTVNRQQQQQQQQQQKEFKGGNTLNALKKYRACCSVLVPFEILKTVQSV